jgi:enoyl-CoA hydratase
MPSGHPFRRAPTLLDHPARNSTETIAMAYETLIVEIEDYVALIRLNRPDAMNALNRTMMQELVEAMTAAETNERVRCIVLTGNDKAFAAGADVREMAELTFVDVYTTDLWGAEATAISRIRKPVIAAVAGYALGGGCELAMLCDFIIAADTAKFGQPEINLGIVAGMGGTQRMTRIIGKAKAMEMHLTGRFMDATEAERAGLVSRVVPAKDLLAEAMKAAGKIAEKSALTAMIVKECVNRAAEAGLAEGMLFERRMFHAMFATEDQKEGMAAFLEKRQPQFRDK